MLGALHGGDLKLFQGRGYLPPYGATDLLTDAEDPLADIDYRWHGRITNRHRWYCLRGTIHIPNTTWRYTYIINSTGSATLEKFTFAPCQYCRPCSRTALRQVRDRPPRPHNDYNPTLIRDRAIEQTCRHRGLPINVSWTSRSRVDHSPASFGWLLDDLWKLWLIETFLL